MKKTLLLFLILFVNFVINAQLSTIQILDSELKKGIDGVAVFNKDNSIFGISDANGFLQLDLNNTFDSLYFQHQSYVFVVFSVSEINSFNNVILLEEKAIQLEVTVISVDKNKEVNERISNKVDVIELKNAELLNPSTSADLLETSGNIYIQKSQGGGGSPIIRGFEANKVLLAIDGVRMNNAIYRGGHLQNAITVDEAMLEKVEVIYGPGSLIYGSDALGGVVHFYTKRPKFSFTDKALTKGNASIKYASVNNEKSLHFDINVGAKKFASLTSVSYSDFGDAQTGKNAEVKYGSWGQTPFYVQNDKIYTNSNPYLQKRTGYKQLDLMQKFKYKENNYLNFELNLQYSTSSNINRYDKLSVVKTEIINDTSNVEFINAKQLNDSTFEIKYPKFADWYYGPQERSLVAFTVNFNKEILFHNKATYILSYQHINESRYKRKFSKNLLSSTLENLNIVTFNADFRKNIKRKNENLKNDYLLYGLELNYNLVESKGREKDLFTNEIMNAQSRYPDNGSTLFTTAFYGKYTHNLSEKMTLSIGARFNHNRLHSQFSQRKFSGQSFSNIQLNNTAVSGSINYIYVPINNLQINALISTGFRAPNVDDVGKVFDPNHQEIVIPNGNLKPEYTYNFELGFVKKFKDKARIDLLGFYTILNNFIQREAFSFNGLDSVFVDNDIEKSQVLANQNSGNAYMTGASLSAKFAIVKGLVFNGTLNYTFGRLEDSVTPLSHIPPMFGRLSLDYRYHNFKTSVYSKFSAWKHTWDYSPLSVDNFDEATKEGTPAWATLNVNMIYSFNKYITATVGVENILDSHYRPFGSGISANGRNFIFSLRGSF